MEETTAFLRSRLDEAQYAKLVRIPQTEVLDFVARYIRLCEPERVFVCDDSPEDVAYIRQGGGGPPRGHPRPYRPL